MKKSLRIIILVCLALIISSIAYADPLYLYGREISAGHPTSYGVEGATFVGNFFNRPVDEGGDIAGYFTLMLNHNANGIEECGQQTQLLGFKLVMNFFPFGRLVLVGPTEDPMTDPVYASWNWDDPLCVNGNCILLGYANFLDPDTDPATDLIHCDDTSEPYTDNDILAAYIAEVGSFNVVKQRVGSWGPPSRGVTGGLVSGFLDHTPYISPAIVGVVYLNP
jgi:hypothetical protein